MSRRDFLKTAGAGAAALGLTGGLPSAAQATSSRAARASGGASGGPYNILFIMSDQETEMRSFPRGYRLPGRERLRRMGVSFDNHQICSCVCTPSRSVMLTGQHIQNTGMFDNVSMPWGQSLSPDIPTIGHMLRDAGYYTAYQGKWHLSLELEEFSHDPGEVPELTGREIFEAHGFSDYIGVGDIIAQMKGGYDNDGFISEISQRWLRVKGKPLNEEGKPWFLAVGFVNPHDVMYYNTDRPGEKVQEQNYLLQPINRAPSHAIYQQKWDVELPATRKQPLDEPGRPRAHWEQATAVAGMLGTIPNEDRRWRDLNNYYLNCIQDNDRHLEALLDELEALGMLDNTIIVFTSDHGDLAGAHAMWGKGATAYREQNNVPFIVAHPEFQGGRTCRAVTSHADLVPTMVGLSGASPEKKAALTKELPGKDVTGVLGSPEQAPLNAVREGALYNFAMLTALDGGFMFEAAKALHAGGPEEVARRGIQPDVKKRGHIRTIFDGRYRFSRYFSPLEHNRPTTMAELTRLNDLELYDVESDPLEAKNLAADLRKNGELAMAMNAKLNALIDEEVGEDDGSFIPWDNIKSLLVTEPDP
jgi:arylsulfatase